jgi:hypothetical protein
LTISSKIKVSVCVVKIPFDALAHVRTSLVGARGKLAALIAGTFPCAFVIIRAGARIIKQFEPTPTRARMAADFIGANVIASAVVNRTLVYILAAAVIGCQAEAIVARASKISFSVCADVIATTVRRAALVHI